MARVVGQAVSGLAPKMVMMTPVEAVRKVAKKVGWNLADVDLFELNEAFAVQAVAVMKELGIDPARVNVHGGAVALGHPIGASRRARADDAPLRALKHRSLKRGIATLCLGGGNGVALAVEMLTPVGAWRSTARAVGSQRSGRRLPARAEARRYVIYERSGGIHDRTSTPSASSARERWATASRRCSRRRAAACGSSTLPAAARAGEAGHRARASRSSSRRAS